MPPVRPGAKTGTRNKGIDQSQASPTISPFIERILKAIKNLYANMDVLISIGTSAAFLLGIASFFIMVPVFFEVAAFIMAFQLLGRYLETQAKGKTSEALRELLRLGAKTAKILYSVLRKVMAPSLI